MGKILDAFMAVKKRLLDDAANTLSSAPIIIQVGSATCENAAGAQEVRREFEKLLLASGRADIFIKQTGCTGRCSREPIVGVYLPDQFPIKYEKVTVEKVQQIFQQHILGGQPVVPLILDKKTSRMYSWVVTFASLSTVETDSASRWNEKFKEHLKIHGVPEETIRSFIGGCLGLYPAGKEGNKVGMLVFPEKVVYEFGTEEDLARIIQSHFKDRKTLTSMQAEIDPLIKRFITLYGDVAFFNKQTRLTLRNSGIIDPESLKDYVANDGFEALARVLENGQPQAVIQAVILSGLRGRGGAGFPTGSKWQSAVDNPDPVKYVVCNADEGDPGAYMDRSTLEGDPFSIIHGMALGAFAIGASKGYIYVRAEYPLAIRRLEYAIRQCEDAGLLGKNILGSDFSFEIELRLGAGAFVCGEETALMLSITGRRGQPMIRPPYPTERGLWGHPTVINNVETWSNIPVIIRHGAEWFARIGTEKSKGTKVFALAGKIVNSGLVEVPMGTTLREIIYDIGGGVEKGRTLKAVQTGGPSGGCIPADLIDTPVDYDSLAAVGSIMGSGGMIVLDDEDCMVAMAKFFLEFTQDESCGKCVPCREGTLRMLEILERITAGQGMPEDLDKLERLGNLIKKTSLCGLGQSAPNPVLSALRYFRSEFEAHVLEKCCPTRKCSKLIRYEINPEKCIGCTLCARQCPVNCIEGTARKPHLVIQERCIKCGNCFAACKFEAVDRV
ncbi:NADH-quinone oxidoreductase subunit NuoF [candidate division FCPU426 bacterium]|nr:NADH-quinone oxidoreductase subunit NuoF [candidate division FCPU426 bacterium]